MSRGRGQQVVCVQTENIEVTEASVATNRLKAVLKNRLTQEEFARRVGISFRQANRIILGKASPSLVVAKRMSVVLGQPIEYLFQIRVKTRKAAN